MVKTIPKIDRISMESAVTRAASVLRKIAIAAQDDEFLGSEEALAEQLGVSPPTLRQAGRILQFEELLRIKRGIAGGYFVRRPSIDVAVATAGIYLAANGVKPNSGFAVIRAISDLLHRGAALCDDAALRAQLEPYLHLCPLPPAQQWERERSLTDLLARMTGNETLRLVLLIVNFSGTAVFDVNMPVDPAYADTFLRLRRDLVQAILDRDHELAASIGQERTAMVNRMLRLGRR